MSSVDKKKICEFVCGFKEQNHLYLAKALSLLESTLEADRHFSSQLYKALMSDAKLKKRAELTKRVGITGAPGVGKSTFIESLGLELIKESQKVGVLTVDPSSQLSGGSVLGDKTRMELLSRSEQAFIRPYASGVQLGGLFEGVSSSLDLFECFGFDYLLLETVGVGQSEYALIEEVDCVILLLLPGAGDDLQTVKRGIMEVSDFWVLNKMDQWDELGRESIKGNFQFALELLPGKNNFWKRRLHQISALEKEGIGELHGSLVEFYELHKMHEKTQVPFSRAKKNFWNGMEKNLLEKFESFKKEKPGRVLEKNFIKDKDWAGGSGQFLKEMGAYLKNDS